MALKAIRYFIFIMAVLIMFPACKAGGENPGYDFFPDMYYSPAYQHYKESDVFADGKSAREPVQGTIPHDIRFQFATEEEMMEMRPRFLPFLYENTLEEYERAGAELTNPMPATEENLRQGKRIYEIQCAICHGSGGEGDGPIVQREVFPPPPSFTRPDILELSDGKMYFSVHYGRGMMGSYSYIPADTRWNIIHYIRSLQGMENGEIPDEGGEMPDEEDNLNEAE